MSSEAITTRTFQVFPSAFRVNESHQNLNINIIPLDVRTLVDNAIANPSQFGFTNVTSNFLQSDATNANQFLFWDDVHPTNPGHNLIADLALKAITSIPELTSLRI